VAVDVPELPLPDPLPCVECEVIACGLCFRNYHRNYCAWSVCGHIPILSSFLYRTVLNVFKSGMCVEWGIWMLCLKAPEHAMRCAWSV
jgi:hypothetical protein